MKESLNDIFEEKYLKTRMKYINKLEEWNFLEFNEKQQDFRGTLIAMLYYTYKVEEKQCRLIADSSLERVRQRNVSDSTSLNLKEFLEKLSHELIKETKNLERR